VLVLAAEVSHIIGGEGLESRGQVKMDANVTFDGKICFGCSHAGWPCMLIALTLVGPLESEGKIEVVADAAVTLQGPGGCWLRGY
jgi:hypothetical protein